MTLSSEIVNPFCPNTALGGKILMPSAKQIHLTIYNIHVPILFWQVSGFNSISYHWSTASIDVLLGALNACPGKLLSWNER